MMWQMQAYVDAVRDRVSGCATMAGANADLVLDAAESSLMPGDAAFVATALERGHLLWFDEPTKVHTNDALAKITGGERDAGRSRPQYSRRIGLPEPAALGMHRHPAPLALEQHCQDPPHGGGCGDSLCGDRAIS